MSPGLDDALFVVPTICDEIPRVQSSRFGRPPTFRVREDDWRQIELVSCHHKEIITNQLRVIRTVRNESLDVPGFRRVHVREQPRHPLEGAAVTRPDLDALFAGPRRVHSRLGFETGNGVIPGGFAYRLDDRVTAYGVVVDRYLHTIGFEAVGPPTDNTLQGIVDLTTSFDLMLVNWVRAIADRNTTTALEPLFPA